MDRAWLSGASATPPVAPVAPSLGYPTAGDPGVGLPATVPGPWWHHMITEELRALIEAAGLTPSHLSLTQVRDAINKLAVRRSVASLQVSVAGNALTGTLAAEALEFRSSSLTNGSSVTRVSPVAASLTVPSGATLGTASGVRARLVWGWIDNAGALEPFVANMAGGINLDESTLVNTTAISATANSAGVIYSQSARTGVAFRVRGYCDITEAAAGVWAVDPYLVQGEGGLSLASLTSLGCGQAWKELTASRAIGATYYNTTGKPIVVSLTVQCAAASGNGCRFYVSELEVSQFYTYSAVSAIGCINAIVPPGASYRLSNAFGANTLALWNELR